MPLAETSLESYHTHRSRFGPQEKRLLDAYRQHGGLTDNEAAELLALPPGRISARRHTANSRALALYGAPVIAKTKKRRQNRGSRTKSIVWYLADPKSRQGTFWEEPA